MKRTISAVALLVAVATISGFMGSPMGQAVYWRLSNGILAPTRSFVLSVTGLRLTTDPVAGALVTMDGDGDISPASTVELEISGDVAFPGAVTIGATLQTTTIEEQSVALSGASPDCNLALGTVFTHTAAAETTFTFTNPGESGKVSSFTLIETNGGSQTLHWPASVKWAGGTAPILTTSGIDILCFITLDAGTTWYGFLSGIDMK